MARWSWSCIRRSGMTGRRRTRGTRSTVIARGKGLFFDGERRYPVEAGAFLFAATGQVHRFADFSPDFSVWVAFYGPEGGEAAG
jgi:hypothetical protein